MMCFDERLIEVSDVSALELSQLASEQPEYHRWLTYDGSLTQRAQARGYLLDLYVCHQWQQGHLVVRMVALTHAGTLCWIGLSYVPLATYESPQAGFFKQKTLPIGTWLYSDHSKVMRHPVHHFKFNCCGCPRQDSSTLITTYSSLSRCGIIDGLRQGIKTLLAQPLVVAPADSYFGRRRVFIIDNAAFFLVEFLFPFFDHSSK